MGWKSFRLEEYEHMILQRLNEINYIIENKTLKLLDSPNEVYQKTVRTPWSEKMKLYELLEAF